MRGVWSLALAAVAVLEGCSSPASQVSAVEPDRAAYERLTWEAKMDLLHAVDVFVWEALTDLPDGVPLSTARKLGKVLNEQVVYRDNEYIPGEKVEERTLTFDGLVVSGWVDKGKFRRTHVLITKPDWRVRDGLGVGADVKALARALGRADVRKGEVLRYSGETEAALFTIRSGKVTQVELLIYHE